MGRVRVKISIPKKVLIRATIAQAAKTITRPTRAAVIIFLAASVCALSPPEAIQRIPPITSIKKKTSAAITTVNLINAEMIFGNVRLPNLTKLPDVGFRFIVSAKSSFCTSISIIESPGFNCQEPVDF